MTVWFLGYVGLHAFLYFVLEPRYVRYLQRNKHKLCVIDKVERPNNVQRLNQFIEYGVLARYSFLGFKNNVNLNLRFFSALMTTTGFMFFIQGVLSVLVFAGLPENTMTLSSSMMLYCLFFVFTAFHYRQSLVQNWRHLSQQYNEILKREKGQDSTRIALEISFISDLLQLEMWSHPSYEDSFEKTVLKLCGARPKKGKADKSQSVLDFVRSHPLTKDEIFSLLDQSKATILPKTKKTLNKVATMSTRGRQQPTKVA